VVDFGLAVLNLMGFCYELSSKSRFCLTVKKFITEQFSQTVFTFQHSLLSHFFNTDTCVPKFGNILGTLLTSIISTGNLLSPVS
jgi:hypothetical protein